MNPLGWSIEMNSATRYASEQLNQQPATNRNFIIKIHVVVFSARKIKMKRRKKNEPTHAHHVVGTGTMNDVRHFVRA